MSNDDLFMRAARGAFRYPTTRGDLTTEQLFSLPLVSAGPTRLDLDAVARTLARDLREMGEESFVAKVNPAREVTAAKLEVVKAVIAYKQNLAAENEKKAEKAQRIEKIRDAIAASEDRALSAAPVEELKRQLAELQAS